MAKEPFDFDALNLGNLMSGLGDLSSVAGKQIEDTMSMLFDGLKKGIMPKKVFNVGEESIESLYTQAYTMYNQGKYKEASYLFLALMTVDPTVPKHVMGCAACFHRQNMYEKASELYIICSSLDPENPFPDFHAADCWIKMQCPEAAILHLKTVIERAKDSPEYAVVKERAAMMLKTLESEVQDSPQKSDELPKNS